MFCLTCHFENDFLTLVTLKMTFWRLSFWKWYPQMEQKSLWWIYTKYHLGICEWMINPPICQGWRVLVILFFFFMGEEIQEYALNEGSIYKFFSVKHEISINDKWKVTNYKLFKTFKYWLCWLMIESSGHNFWKSMS